MIAKPRVSRRLIEQPVAVYEAGEKRYSVTVDWLSSLKAGVQGYLTGEATMGVLYGDSAKAV